MALVIAKARACREPGGSRGLDTRKSRREAGIRGLVRESRPISDRIWKLYFLRAGVTTLVEEKRRMSNIIRRL